MLKLASKRPLEQSPGQGDAPHRLSFPFGSGPDASPAFFGVQHASPGFPFGAHNHNQFTTGTPSAVSKRLRLDGAGASGSAGLSNAPGLPSDGGSGGCEEMDDESSGGLAARKRVRRPDHFAGVNAAAAASTSQPGADWLFFAPSSAAAAAAAADAALAAVTAGARAPSDASRAGACGLPDSTRTFGAAEVRAVVSRALELREAQLRAEYEKVLQTRLQEQFSSFSRYHEEYVSRQLRQSEFSYMS
ncbi:hypothetical protein T492DRAFT_1055436 [Pavlovales sp. CCMP2436]|nr:hypothetical protein T492DRAFT_1055436 [Pavlovales sp. CCMP2436]